MLKLLAVTATIVLLAYSSMALGGGVLSFQAAVESPELLKAAELSKEVVRLYAEKNYKEALEPAKQALEIREKVLGKDHQLVAEALSNLGAVYMGVRNYSEAESCYKRAVEINEKTHGPDDRVLAPLLDKLGWLSYANGYGGKAEQLFNRGLSIREKTAGPNSQEVPASLYNLARFYEKIGNYRKSVEYYKRDAELKEKLLGPNTEAVAELLEQCSCVLTLNHQTAEAKELGTRASEIRKSLDKRSQNAERVTGKVLQGMATYRAEPVYPPMAKAARISGSVIIEVTIDERGNVVDAKARCGSDIFAEASLTAARKWRFAPTTLNGKPVKVIGSVTFNFVM